jgi:hypothetical protein
MLAISFVSGSVPISECGVDFDSLSSFSFFVA